MEDKVIENESEAIETPANEFACLGIAECQQVLERLKGGIIFDELPFAVKALLDKYEYDESTLRQEVGKRKSELEHYRKKTIELHIAKKYTQALEGYDEYFEKLGSQVTDYEAEQLRKECQQYVSLAKKRKWQVIAAVVIVLVLCGVIVDQIFFRQNIKSFQVALQGRDYEKATEVAIRIGWRYDTEEGILNLVCFLDEKNKFNQLCGQELTRSSLDEYGGMKWQEALKLVEQACTNQDLSQGIQQLRLAAEKTKERVKECEALGVMERDFDVMYESCNQMDAAHYASEKWEHLQQLRETEVTQTNLTLISERYSLMVGITNQVVRLMEAQRDMQPVKDVFEKRLKEEQIKVQEMLNYSSSQLDEAQKLAGIALAKEKEFQFADARLIYTRAIEHIKVSQKNQREDGGELAKIDRARKEFNDLYEKQDMGLAKESYPDDWEALSIQIEKAKSEYDKKDRWKGDAYVCYEAASGKLKKLIKKMKIVDELGKSKEAFDILYGKLDVGLAESWFPDRWNALFNQKKKADAAYEQGDHWEDVIVYYEVTSQMLEDLMREISIKSKIDFLSRYRGKDEGTKEVMKNNYPDDWSNLQHQIEKAKVEYKKPRHWESNAYNLYIEAEKTLREIYDKTVEEKKLIIFDMSGYEESMKPVSEYLDKSPNLISNGIPNL